ncbi:MAG: hypothetical protein U9R38_01720 [Candidatus Margulisiibacteriota bacterium]|nr:hypothetical protein [Candidatus Margulisiibacteriota bacterium]
MIGGSVAAIAYGEPRLTLDMDVSEKHIEDIKGMLKISKSIMDLCYIDKWAIKIGVQDIWQKIKSNKSI